MKIIYLALIFLFLSFYANAETYYCQFLDTDKIKNIKFDRTGHSHFKKCQDTVCDKIGLSIINVDNNNLIFGDIYQDERNVEYFQIYFLDKRINIFKGLKISMPGSNFKNTLIEGFCSRKN